MNLVDLSIKPLDVGKILMASYWASYNEITDTCFSSTHLARMYAGGWVNSLPHYS